MEVGLVDRGWIGLDRAPVLQVHELEPILGDLEHPGVGLDLDRAVHDEPIHPGKARSGREPAKCRLEIRVEEPTDDRSIVATETGPGGQRRRHLRKNADHPVAGLVHREPGLRGEVPPLATRAARVLLEMPGNRISDAAHQLEPIPIRRYEVVKPPIRRFREVGRGDTPEGRGVGERC